MLEWSRVLETVKSIRRLLLVILAVLDALETLAQSEDE